MWFAGSTNDIPLLTLNGAQAFTFGSNTVSVPAVTTTATGAPCVCQPKVPPGLTVYVSRIVAPAVVLIVVACIWPAASAFAMIGGLAASDDDAVARANSSAIPSTFVFMSSSYGSVNLTRRTLRRRAL